MPHRAPAPLQKAAIDGKACIVEIEIRHHLAHPLPVEQFGIHPMQAHGIAGAGIGIALAIRMAQHQHPTLADHGVEIEILFEPFPELEGFFIERVVFFQQVIGADDGGVAAHIARTDMVLLQHRHIGDAVFLGQIIGGRQSMPAAAHNDHIIVRLGFRLPPGRLGKAVASERMGEKA